MNQHLESYTSGFYQVFDSRNFLRGIRKHVWIGKWRYNLALRNKDIDEETFNKAKVALEKDFKPISDMRASRSYRIEVAKNLLEKCGAEIQKKKTIGLYS